MMYQFQLVVAVILGQAFFTSLAVFYFQINLQNIGYRKSVLIYINKNLATYVIIVFLTLIILFILSDWMNLHLTKDDLMKIEKRTKFQEAQLRFRTYATMFGIFAQWIAFMIYKGGKKAIEDVAKKNGLDITEADSSK